jgi:hypothetical protein
MSDDQPAWKKVLGAFRFRRGESEPEGEHMYSIAQRCLAEAEVLPPETITFDAEGNILAPNGAISEYNQFRKKDESGKYIVDPKGNDRGIMLAKMVRTKTFLEGSESPKWIGFGNWLDADAKDVATVRYETTGEPRPLYHGTKVVLDPKEGLKPFSPFTNGIKIIWFSTSAAYSSAEAFGKDGFLYMNFLSNRTRASDVTQTSDTQYNTTKSASFFMVTEVHE